MCAQRHDEIFRNKREGRERARGGPRLEDVRG